MAEAAAQAEPRTPAERTPGTLAESVRAYRLVVGMWMRSTTVYRASFVMTAAGNFAATALDFVTIMLMFSHIHALGGFTLSEVAFLYGTASTSFGLADLLMGSMDRLGERVRDGTLDTLMLRPAPVLAQVAADRFALRRLGRLVQGLLVLGWSLPRAGVDWTPVNLALLPLTLLVGAAIFGAVFVAGGAFQFWAGDAAQLQNSVTYGGATLLQYPPALFSRELVRGVTFVVPLAFVNWLPALHMMGRPDPLGLPGWVDFAGAPVAAACCALSWLVWRAGVRSYRSTGS
ncbi:ABC transporter permease [Actinacidiphila bryophytorum]|uniref:ABC-2 type transport system permease protein n=1 Tax=Actinacidiphila bryophytorum TaxID=1436133 RepID=A0A9W4GYT5_9ACTN|nr:ABC-2 type transport system permease protein [Actinacidiphila bryophytorum]